MEAFAPHSNPGIHRWPAWNPPVVPPNGVPPMSLRPCHYPHLLWLVYKFVGRETRHAKSEGLQQQSPGSRSAPWVFGPTQSTNPERVLHPSTCETPSGHGFASLNITQGALRDPGLCCATASPYSNSKSFRPNARNTADKVLVWHCRLFLSGFGNLLHFATRFLFGAITFQPRDLAANLFRLGFKIPKS